MNDKIIDELFCLNFELKMLSEQSLYRESERWVKGFTYKEVEKSHLDRYFLACKYAEGKNILDIACGSGYGDYLLINEGHAKSVTGVDLNNDAIRYGNIRYFNTNITRIVADATQFSSSKKFDFIISYETIEHIPNYMDFLVNLNQNLNEDGLLIISTPISRYTTKNTDNPYHVIEWSFSDFHNLVSQHFTIYKIFVQDIIIERKEYRPTILDNRFYNRVFPKKPSIYLEGIREYKEQFDMRKCISGFQILILKKNDG